MNNLVKRLRAYASTRKGELAELITEAADALERQTCEDAVSRQAAIDAIGTWDKFGVDERCRIVRWHEGLEPYVHLRDVVTAIANLPSAQPEIIRCKECIHWKHSAARKSYCDVFDWVNNEDDFCSFAERKDGD